MHIIIKAIYYKYYIILAYYSKRHRKPFRMATELCRIILKYYTVNTGDIKHVKLRIKHLYIFSDI